MQNLKRLTRAIFSMRAALAILLLLVLACVAGSVIPQGEIPAYYEAAYPGRAGWLILLLGLDDTFHQPWFAILTAFLCLNLLGCNLLRFPRLIQRMRTGFTLERCMAAWDGAAQAEITGEPEALFARMGFGKVQSSKDTQGRDCRYAARNRIGIWGAWLTHLGMLVIILGFALGQMCATQYSVYGVPGQTKAVGDTEYGLTIDDFRVELRDDDTVEQYTARLTLTDAKSGRSASGEASVNHPLKLFGMKLYQNSTGWAADVRAWKGEELLQQEVLCAGEQMNVEGMEGLTLAFNAFYPDYATDASGAPCSASSRLNNPAYLYTLYYQGRVLGMNALPAGERITVEDCSIAFDAPRSYTLIQIKRDPFTWLAGIGGILLMLALLVAFYLRTEELWAVRREDGSWAFAGRSPKGGALFKEKLAQAARKLDQPKR